MVNLVISGTVIICLIFSIIIYYSKTNFIFKLIVLPFTVAFFIFLVNILYDIMGAPLEGFPPDEFNYIHHRAINRGEQILLWVNVDNKDRLYIFDYNREDMKELEKAREQAQEQHAVPMQITATGEFKLNHEAEPDEFENDNRLKQEGQYNEH